MNYDTTPTPSFKPQLANRKEQHVYYQQENNNSDWVVSTGVSTPSTSDSYKTSTSHGIEDEMQQRQ
jgi:hypothetical protein